MPLRISYEITPPPPRGGSLVWGVVMALLELRALPPAVDTALRLGEEIDEYVDPTGYTVLTARGYQVLRIRQKSEECLEVQVGSCA